MTRSADQFLRALRGPHGRIQVVILIAVVQFFLGAFSSLALGAPGVGPGAGWIPDVLVGEAFTILPIGFIMCLWGSAGWRPIAAICAAGSVALALAASLALAAGGSSVAPFGFPLGFALLAVPGVALIVSILLRRGASAEDGTS